MEQLATLNADEPAAAAVVPLDVVEPRDRRFCTDHLMDDLKGRSVRGGAVTMAAQVVQFTLRFISIPILSRLLTPEDFGLVAMVTAVTMFIGSFKDAGLSLATVQRARITHEQVSTLFWINMFLSILVMLFTAALAPVMVWFYHEPRLLGITIVSAATSILGGLSIQHGALLTRQMRFGALAAIRVVSLTASVVAAVTAAYWGAAYWSLVIMTAVELAVTALMTCTMSGWWPGLPKRGSGVRSMLVFGGNLTAAETTSYLAGGLGNALVGWWWGASVLGLFTQALRVLVMISGQLIPPLRSVALPALSRLQDRPEEYARYYLRIANIMAWIGFPSAAFLIFNADDFVRIVFGPQWTECISAFRMFGPVTALLPLYQTVQWLFVSRGRTDTALRWSIVAAILVLVSYAIGVPFGITGIAAAYAVIWCAITLPLGFRAALKASLIRSSAILKAVLWPAVASLAVITVCMGAAPLLTQQSSLTRLASQSMFAGAGLVFCLIIFQKMRAELTFAITPLLSSFLPSWFRRQSVD